MSWFSRFRSPYRDNVLNQWRDSLFANKTINISPDEVSRFLRPSHRTTLVVDPLPDGAYARYRRDDRAIDIAEAYTLIGVSLVSNPDPLYAFIPPPSDRSAVITIERKPITIIGVDPCKKNNFNTDKKESRFKIYGVK